MGSFDYLFYKFYRAHLRGWGDIAHVGAVISVGIAISINILVIGAFLRKIDLLPTFFANKRQVIIFTLCLFATSFIFFMAKGRYKNIIAKYEHESEYNRKKGNLIVLLYVIISFLLIFVVAFYKPGKI